MRPAESLSKLLDALHRKLRAVQRVSLGRHLPRGVTLGEAKVVRAVERVGNSGVSVIAQYLDLSHPSAASLIGKLRERGLIAIQQAGTADGRKKRLRLTVKGAEVEEAQATAEREAAEMLLSALNKEEQIAFVLLLEKVVAGKDGFLTPEQKDAAPKTKPMSFSAGPPPPPRTSSAGA